MPVADQAAQQVGAAQEGRVRRGGATEDEVVAATGADMAAVDHELLAGQARLPRGLVEEFGALDQLLPTAGGVDVHLDDARVRGDAEYVQARVAGRLVALQQHGALQLARGGLDGGDQFQPGVEFRQWRHEQVQAPVAGSAHRAVRTTPAADWWRPGAASAWPGLRTLAQLGADLRGTTQRREGLAGVGGVDVGVVGLADPGLRIQRQAVAHRRIAWQQAAVLVAQEPGAGLPAVASGVAPRGSTWPTISPRPCSKTLRRRSRSSGSARRASSG